MPQGRFHRPVLFSQKACPHTLRPRCLEFQNRGSANPRAKWGRTYLIHHHRRKIGLVVLITCDTEGLLGIYRAQIRCVIEIVMRIQVKSSQIRPITKGNVGLGLHAFFACVSSPPGLIFDYSPRWVSELDLPFSVGEDGHIIGDYFDFVCSFISNEIREHCADKRGHSTRVV